MLLDPVPKLGRVFLLGLAKAELGAPMSFCDEMSLLAPASTADRVSFSPLVLKRFVFKEFKSSDLIVSKVILGVLLRGSCSS
jgi:hypothetical protein